MTNITLPSLGSYEWQLNEDNEDREWHEFALKRMLESYGEGDCIYDDEKGGMR